MNFNSLKWSIQSNKERFCHYFKLNLIILCLLVIILTVDRKRIKINELKGKYSIRKFASFSREALKRTNDCPESVACQSYPLNDGHTTEMPP